MSSRKVVPISSSPATSSSRRSKSICSSKQTKELFLQDHPEIIVVKQISQAKFPVYLAFIPSTGQSFALKVFQSSGKEPHPYFKNEIRFSFLDHPNVTKIVRIPSETVVTSENGEEQQVSSILMEYAPYGDFFDFIRKAYKKLDEKLIRTYFHQLIEGIEYLHKNNVLHLDIKPENLLIGDDYQLKITDFDLSHIKGDPDTFTIGTKYYRAPELQAGNKQVSGATDIYAAGIILFVLKCGGVLPHLEDELCKGVNLRDLIITNPAEFFTTHCHIQGKKSSFFSRSFKELFISMVNSEPEERISTKEIKKSTWYRGSIYTHKELIQIRKELLTN